MPVDAPLLLENVLDPDHGEFAHGNFQGFAPFQAHPDKQSSITVSMFKNPGAESKLSRPSAESHLEKYLQRSKHVMCCSDKNDRNRVR
eukprot:scaffold266472_cov37-Prasinocladus_malaysianus.AAC.1